MLFFSLTNFLIKVCGISLVSAGVSVTSSNTGVPDISGSVYTKTQVITVLEHLDCSLKEDVLLLD